MIKVQRSYKYGKHYNQSDFNSCFYNVNSYNKDNKGILVTFSICATILLCKSIDSSTFCPLYHDFFENFVYMNTYLLFFRCCTKPAEGGVLIHSKLLGLSPSLV